MDTAKQAFNYVAETVQGVTAGASKETNKNIAKNDEANVSTRITAAKDAIGDKYDETSHDNKAAVHKNLAKHS